MSEEIVVSILCVTYNHEKYIKDALESFIMQKTDFAFEVIVHDDASTDNTASIIHEYEKKYPQIIKPVYQKENQYSKGVKITKDILWPMVNGKYIALCEGDDYWTDPLKLQKQYEVLEKHPEIDICAHSASCINCITGKETLIRPSKVDTLFTQEEVIVGDGGFVATASLFYRTELRNKIPNFYKELPLDYSLQILGSIRGGMFFLNDIMSVYRFYSVGSWSESMKIDKNKHEIHMIKIISMLKQLNEDTFYQYEDAINKQKMKYEFGLLVLYGDKKALKEPYWSSIYRKLLLKEKLKIFLKLYFPFLLKLKQSSNSIKKAWNIKLKKKKYL